MGSERFKPNTSNSFLGDFLYQQIIPSDHFLVHLKQVIPWQRFTDKLLQYYRGRGKEGRPPYDPAVLLKMLLLAYLYNLSERQVEEQSNLYLPAKYFLGLGVDEKAPDHTTLTAFKKRILENGKLAAYEKLLQEIVRLAVEKGVKFGALQIVDSTHSVAHVNVKKDEGRQRKGQLPRDGSAAWGVKRSYRRGLKKPLNVMLLEASRSEKGVILERKVRLTSDWLVQYIRDHGGVLTISRDIVVD